MRTARDESENLRVALLANLCRLTAKLAKVVQLGAANISAANELDVVDDGRVNGELSLNSNLERHLTNAECFANSVTGARNDDTLEYLNTASGTFDDVDVNLDVVSDSEVGNVGAQRRCVNGIKLLHDDFSFYTRFGTTAGRFGRNCSRGCSPEAENQ